MTNQTRDPAVAVPRGAFLATIFSGAGRANADPSLLIATSGDGVMFRNLRSSPEALYAPAGGRRDMSVLRAERRCCSWRNRRTCGAGRRWARRG